MVVERFKERPGTDLVDIDVNIYCERESHKGMVIGKGGAMLKKIASAARADCEDFLGCRVNLQCWVKVKADWAGQRVSFEQLRLPAGYRPQVTPARTGQISRGYRATMKSTLGCI